MAKILIVQNSDLAILSRYDAAAPAQEDYGGPWGWADQTTHVEVPAELDHECIEAINVAEKWTKEGEADASEAPLNWEIEGWTHAPAHIDCQEDAELLTAKLQRQREAKLSLMRSQRDAKMKDVDVMVNELVLDERVDGAAIAAYRTALKVITDDYKEQDGSASSGCDTLEADLSDLVWPIAP